MGRRAALATGLLSLAAIVSTADERPIYRFPAEIRKRNYVRLSTQNCDECMTLEDFYKGNPLGFVLFYERALMGGHKYKEAIVRGWMESCQELRWSRIACGMVDMVSDRAYAERYIDPKTAPAHIVVRNSEPVMAMKEQVDPLLKKPGDKAVMLEHVADLLKDEGSMASLSLSVQANGKEALQRILRRHQVVIAAFIGEDKRLADTFRGAVQEAVLSHGVSSRVDAEQQGLPSEEQGRRGKGKSENKERGRIAYVASHGKGLSAHHGVAEGDRCIAVFIDGVLQPGVLTMRADAKLGDSEVLEAVKKSAKLATSSVTKVSPGQRQGKGSKGNSEL